MIAARFSHPQCGEFHLIAAKDIAKFREAWLLLQFVPGAIAMMLGKNALV